MAEDRPAAEYASDREESCRGLSERYPAESGSVPAARRAVLEFAATGSPTERQLEAVALATSEAVTNAVVHAYPASAGWIEVDGWLVGGELWLIIADDGCGLRAGSQRRGLGLGLALISRMADSLSIQDRSSGGTAIRMHFALGGSAGQSRGWVSSATSPAAPRFSTTT